MASNNNGAPYQKAGYHAIGSGSPTNGGGSGSGSGGSWKKWILGLGLVGVVAVVLGLYSSGTIGGGASSSAASKATLKKQVDDSGAKTNADGSLKLFDDMSK
jgi:hypothetical protein